MDPTSRRRLLRSGCGVAALGVAGCLGGRGVLSTGEAVDSDGYEIVQYSTALGLPEWREEGRAGSLDVFASEDDVRESLELEELSEDRRDAVEAFVADTDFEKRLLLYVASAGPSTCYDRIEVHELGIEEATMTGEVAAIDTSGGNVDCGAAETYPSALIEPAFDDRPERVELTVVDGWGEGETVERTID